MEISAEELEEINGEDPAGLKIIVTELKNISTNGNGCIGVDDARAFVVSECEVQVDETDTVRAHL